MLVLREIEIETPFSEKNSEMLGLGGTLGFLWGFSIIGFVGAGKITKR